MQKLRACDEVRARALEFLVLTAARAGEVLGMHWQEVDLAAKAWTVPASRMKCGREHRVPLSQGRARCPRGDEAGGRRPSRISGKPRPAVRSLELTRVHRRLGYTSLPTASARRSAIGPRSAPLSRARWPRRRSRIAVGSEVERAYRAWRSVREAPTVDGCMGGVLWKARAAEHGGADRQSCEIEDEEKLCGRRPRSVGQATRPADRRGACGSPALDDLLCKAPRAPGKTRRQAARCRSTAPTLHRPATEHRRRM